ncbi:MAG: AsmA family protein [Proteobacteria bacterium]|nr:AsmA family protein [Pseudomonadota bacterium]
MSRRRRIALWSGLCVPALIVIAISWLLTTELGHFKPQIERWASEKTGRQISIKGDLQINLARQSSIVVEDVHIGNPAWAEQPEMLSVGRLEVRFDLGSIFSGPLLVDLIDLDDAKLSLIESESGDRNWVWPKEGEVAAVDPGADKKGILFAQIDVDRV